MMKKIPVIVSGLALSSLASANQSHGLNVPPKLHCEGRADQGVLRQTPVTFTLDPDARNPAGALAWAETYAGDTAPQAVNVRVIQVVDYGGGGFKIIGQAYGVPSSNAVVFDLMAAPMCPQCPTPIFFTDTKGFRRDFTPTCTY